MNPALSRQDTLINAVELPDTIERIVVRSAIGDSGGNGNHRTLRSVMLVRTELTREELREIFIGLGFHHIGMDVRNWDYPEFIIRQAISYQFSSPRNFRLEFEELRSLDEFAGYYFIEFIR